jgi:undecaprenyl diphosphate synthase
VTDSSDLICEAPKERRPRHIAIIMDGNGRWAQQHNLPRAEGHLRGVESVRRTMHACRDLGIEVLTLYCLSSENWKRPATELEFLMTLLKQYLIGERQELVDNNLRLRIIGERDRIPDEVQAEMDLTIQACSKNTGMTLCLAINYGSRSEIVRAIQQISEKVRLGKLAIDQINEAVVSEHLDTVGMPDPDLLIRTSGEMRISNYLLWQISYAEIWVTPTLWPDFDKQHLIAAIQDFAARDRRFGGIKIERKP